MTGSGPANGSVKMMLKRLRTFPRTGYEMVMLSSTRVASGRGTVIAIGCAISASQADRRRAGDSKERLREETQTHEVVDLHVRLIVAGREARLSRAEAVEPREDPGRTMGDAREREGRFAVP